MTDIGRDLGHGFLNDADGSGSFVAELVQKRNDFLSGDYSVAEKYFRGDLYVVIKFDRTAVGDICDDCIGTSAPTDSAISHRHENPTIGVEDLELGNAACPDNGGDDRVLIRVVEKVDDIEQITSSAGECLAFFEQIPYFGAGCFYSFATGFKVGPIITSGKFEIAVLRAAVIANELPCHMIKGTPQIVDSIAYYQGEFSRHFFVEANPNGGFPGFWVGANANVVRISFDERFKLPLEVVDVMIGPLDL